jgi:hypothetical protein
LLGCLPREIRELGYPGRSNLLVRYINHGRADAERSQIAPRKAAQILLARPDNLTDGQGETAARLSSACPEMKALAGLISAFAALASCAIASSSDEGTDRHHRKRDRAVRLTDAGR